MDERNVKIRLLVLCLLVCGLFILSGCKGDTGPAGAPGTPATFGTTDCTTCHHLNNTAINPSNNFFADGLAGGDKTVSAGTSTTLTPVLSKLPAGETAISFLWQQTGGLATNTTLTLRTSMTLTVTVLSQPSGSYGYKQALVDNVPQAGVIATSTETLRDATLVVPASNDAIELASAAQFKLTVFTANGKSFFDLVDVFDKGAQAFLANVVAVNTGLNTVPVNVPVLLKAKTSDTASYDWTVTGPAGPVTVGDSTAQIADFTPVSAGTYTVSVNGAIFPVFAGLWRGETVGTDSSNNPNPDPVCTGCHNDTVATDNFTPWRTSGHAHIFSKNLNSGGHYGPSCFPCHTVGFNLAAVNNGFDDQPGYAAFIKDTSSSVQARITRGTRECGQVRPIPAACEGDECPVRKLPWPAIGYRISGLCRVTHDDDECFSRQRADKHGC